MGWQWNGKQDVTWLLVFLSIVPVAGMAMAIIFPFAHKHPVLFWALVVVLLIAGFVVVCKRAMKK